MGDFPIPSLNLFSIESIKKLEGREHRSVCRGRMDYLFVYGTLRARVSHPMHRVLRSHGQLDGLARFRGRLLDLGDYPAAVSDSSGTWEVVGELYRLQQSEPLLTQLDVYEGCAPESPHPQEYRREHRMTMRANGGSVLAWIYIYNLPLVSPKWITSGDYLNRHGDG